MKELNISRELFNTKLYSMTIYAQRFDELRTTYPDEDSIPFDLCNLRDEVLCEMSELLVQITAPLNDRASSQFIRFVESCMVYYLWSIDVESGVFNYDYYTSLIEDLLEFHDLPENFKDSSLYKFSLGVCTLDDFYDLLYMAVNYSKERI